MTAFPGNESGLPSVDVVPEVATVETFGGQTSQEGCDFKNGASLLYVVAGVFNSNVHTNFVAFMYVELNAVLFRVQDDGVLGVEG